MKAPKKIYLQDGDVESEYYEGVTWSKDKIGKDDTEYIRKDLIEDVIDALISVHRDLLDSDYSLLSQEAMEKVSESLKKSRLS